MHGQPSTVWTPDRIQHLRIFWDEGHSTAEIGRRIGTSKNAVVGKAHRLHLPSRLNPIHGYSPRPPGVSRRPREVPNPAPPPRPPPTLPPLPPLPAVFSSPVNAPSLRPMGPVFDCCWPIGEPGRSNFHFCGIPSEPRKPYCVEHSRLAYVRSGNKEAGRDVPRLDGYGDGDGAFGP